MSGGGIDFVSYKIEDAARELRENSEDPVHKAFADHLDLVAEACYITDRILASDRSYGEDHPYITSILNKTNKEIKIEYLIKEVSRLQDIVKEINNGD